VVGRQNADIADTPKGRCQLAMATTFWRSMGYDFGYVTASNMLFDSRGGFLGLNLSDEGIADFEVLRDVSMAIIFWLSTYGTGLAPLFACICSTRATDTGRLPVYLVSLAHVLRIRVDVS